MMDIRHSYDLMFDVFIGVVSVLAMWQHPVITCLQLVAFLKDPTCILVVNAVTLNGDKLIKTFMLMMLVTYLYAVCGYLAWWNRHGDYLQTCETLFQCFFTYMNEGIRSDGIADVLIRPTDTGQRYPRYIWEAPWESAFILWDFCYFCLVVLILLAIVTGVIIDTFGELRDQATQKSERLKSACFICGLHENALPNFDRHMIEEHDLWSYVAYTIHLQEKPISQHSALESHIHAMLIQGDATFLPSNKAAVLKMHEANDDASNGDVINRINDLESSMDCVAQLVGELSDRLLQRDTRAQTAS